MSPPRRMGVLVKCEACGLTPPARTTPGEQVCPTAGCGCSSFAIEFVELHKTDQRVLVSVNDRDGRLVGGRMDYSQGPIMDRTGQPMIVRCWQCHTPFELRYEGSTCPKCRSTVAY